MPYISEGRRAQIGPDGWCDPDSGGDLNYLFTKLAWKYFNQNGENYQAINDIVGALEGAKLEFYRRVAAPYEDQKCYDNGDVYE